MALIRFPRPDEDWSNNDIAQQLVMGDIFEISPEMPSGDLDVLAIQDCLASVYAVHVARDGAGMQLLWADESGYHDLPEAAR